MKNIPFLSGSGIEEFKFGKIYSKNGFWEFVTTVVVGWLASMNKACMHNYAYTVFATGSRGNQKTGHLTGEVLFDL